MSGGACLIIVVLDLTMLACAGWIPPMLPFGLADTLSSTLDLPTFAMTVWITARETIGNLLIGMLNQNSILILIDADNPFSSLLVGKF